MKPWSVLLFGSAASAVPIIATAALFPGWEHLVAFGAGFLVGASWARAVHVEQLARLRDGLEDLKAAVQEMGPR